MAKKKIKRKKSKAQKPEKRKKDVLKLRKIKIKIIGVGGGAISILKEMAPGLTGANFLVFDTDQRSFKKIPTKIHAVQFGQEITHGWGTGMNPDIAEKAAESEREKIKKSVQGADLAILISCFGGGVGSGASLVISEILREEKITSLGIFTLPFSFEGEKKNRLAKNSLKKIKDSLSGLIVLPNEKILEYSDKKLSLKKSLSLMNDVLIDYLRDLIDMISSPGLINIDFADLKTIIKGKGQMVCFGSGSGQGPNRVEEAMKRIFENPFFICPPKIKKILFNISSGKELALKEVEDVAQRIFRMNPRAKIIFGISQNQKIAKKIKVIFLGVGEGGLEKEEEANVETEKGENYKKEEKKRILIARKKPVRAGGQKTIKKRKRIEKKKEETREITIRRNAIEVKKAEKEEEEKEWTKEPEWEIPSFLRKHIK